MNETETQTEHGQISSIICTEKGVKIVSISFLFLP